MTRTQSDTTNKKRSLSQLRSFYFAFTRYYSPDHPDHPTLSNTPAQCLPLPPQLPISYALSITPLYYAVYRFDPTNSPLTYPRFATIPKHSVEIEQEGKSYPAGRTKPNPLKLKNTPRQSLKKRTIIIYYSAISFPFIAHFALQTEYKRKGD